MPPVYHIALIKKGKKKSIVPPVYHIALLRKGEKTEVDDITTRLVRRSPYSFEDTMNLNLYEDHFSYVSDMEKYSQSYPCLKCDRLWKHVGTLHRHERTCTGSVTSFIDVQDIA